MKYEYDLLVIGGGAAGLTVASGAAQLGAKVALVSKGLLGGDCLFFGCVPSKTLIKSAKIAHAMRHASAFGIQSVEPQYDFNKVTERIDSVIQTAGIHDDPARFRQMGVDVIFGAADFWDRHTVCVRLVDSLHTLQQPEVLVRGKDFLLSAKKIVIATGSRPFIPAIPGLLEAGFLTNETIFSMKTLPPRLAILGAGPIGCELAQAFARLGSKVTLIVRGTQILQKEDIDIAAYMADIFVQEGIEILYETELRKIIHHKKSKLLTLQKNGESQEIEVDNILIATGRMPDMTQLKLENAGVVSDRHGIGTDKKLRTNQKHIYAIGDVNGKYQFTHTAGYEGGIVVSNAILHIPRSIDYDAIPWATFTDPEVASCGLNETEAKERGIKYQVWQHEFAKQDRALAESETHGFIKILTTGRRAKIIGAQIIGAHAGEIIHELILARNAGMTLASLASAVHIYPTLSEIIKTAAGKYFAEKLFTNKVRKILKFLFRYRGKTEQ